MMAGRDLSAELFDTPAGGRDLSAELFDSTPKAEPVTRIEKVLRGVRDPFDGAAQLFEKAMPQGFNDANASVNNWLADKMPGIFSRVGPGGVDALIKQQEQEYQAKRAAAGESGFDGYRTLGNVVSPANLAIAANAPVAATTLGKVAVGIGQGAASGLMNPVLGEGDFATDKLKQVLLGGATGGAVPAIGAGVARIISPNASVNPSLQLLKSEGVKPTIGQTLGGWANRVEEKAQSLPIVGDAITASRNAAKEQFNNAAINRATGNIGVNVEGSGSGAIREAGDKIGKVYEAGKSALGNFAIDGQANAEIATLQQMAQQLPGKERMQFMSALSTLKNQVTPQGHLLPDGFKTIDSKLGADAARFMGSNDAYQQKLGEAIKQLQTIVTDNAKRANPKAAALLDQADAAYANLVRLEGASVAAKGTEGVFTPGQLLTAVRGADKSVRDRATARGTALMQDLASAGNTVLGNKVPNSGTADRLMLGGGALGAYFVNPAIPAGLLLGAGGYLPPVQSALRGLVSARPDIAQPVANMLRQATPALVPGGAQLGLGLLN